MTADRDKIKELHAKSFNCAQVVAFMCRDLSGVDEKTALAAVSGFGGGLRCGEACGSVCGGIFTLGMCYPHCKADDIAAKDKITELTNSLTGKFKEEFGTLVCRELVEARGREGCDELKARVIELVHEIIERD